MLLAMGFMSTGEVDSQHRPPSPQYTLRLTIYVGAPVCMIWSAVDNVVCTPLLHFLERAEMLIWVTYGDTNGALGPASLSEKRHT